jgi:hypothetical protein
VVWQQRRINSLIGQDVVGGELQPAGGVEGLYPDDVYEVTLK